MNNVIAVLAQEGETLPLEESPHPLIPPLYDIVWSLIPLVVILWLFWKFVLPKFQQVLDEREEGSRAVWSVQSRPRPRPRKSWPSTAHSSPRRVVRRPRSATTPAPRGSRSSRI